MQPALQITLALFADGRVTVNTGGQMGDDKPAAIWLMDYAKVMLSRPQIEVGIQEAGPELAGLLLKSKAG